MNATELKQQFAIRQDHARLQALRKAERSRAGARRWQFIDKFAMNEQARVDTLELGDGIRLKLERTPAGIVLTYLPAPEPDEIGSAEWLRRELNEE